MKRLIVIAIFILSVGSVSAQDVRNAPGATGYGKTGIETDASAVTTLSSDLDSPRQVTEFDGYTGLGLSSPLSPSFVDKTETSGDYRWKNMTLYGIGYTDVMIGLMDRRDAGVGILYHKDKLSFSVGLAASAYNFNPLTAQQGSPIQYQFGIRGDISYFFNENVSVTVYGQYVNNPFFHSLAAYPYIATSSFGGYFTLQNDRLGMDLGVNNYYDPFSRSWRTNPIVRPTYKVGKVRIGVDVGPLMTQEILKRNGKMGPAGPVMMPPKPASSPKMPNGVGTQKRMPD